MTKLNISYFIVLFLPCFIFSQSAGDIIITEWQANPTVLTDSDGEYVELYNTTGSAIDINGWVLSDDGTNSLIINTSVIVPPNGFATLATSATPGFVPTWNWDTGIGSYGLTNADDEIVLSFGLVQIARVNYTDGDPFGAGVAAELNSLLNHVAGVTIESNYIASTSNYNGDLGSPGTLGDTALPVELSSFTVKATSIGVICNWTTESEIENLGFIIERKTTELDWLEIVSYKQNNSLLGQGTVSFATNYEYIDKLVQQGNTYEYRLADVDYNGVVTYHSTRKVFVESNPLATIADNFTVMAYPNPFNPNTTIRYSVPVGTGHDLSVKMQIYDISGKLVTTLVNKDQSTGWYEIQWNGTNQTGKEVPGGVYLSRVTVGNEVKTNKLILLK